MTSVKPGQCYGSEYGYRSETPNNSPIIGATTQIVAGNDGAIEDFPFIAEIQQRAKRQEPWRHWCGAVIISENMLVTSAACLRGPMVNRRVRCGFENFADPNKQIRTIKHFKIFPHFDRNVNDDIGVQFDNNIGVIELHTPLKFGPRCQSIPYTTIKGSDGFKNCQISGWGYIDANKTESPDTLQFADISVLSNTKCNDLVDPIIPKTQICTYDFDNKKQPCNGDAGGPLTCEINGRRVLVGVFAWLFNECDAKNPSFYSHVAYYTSFIEKWTGITGIP
ncbi:chymotrypsinogen A-like [Mytilus edulis]|uniref:chymotrypsinogen A-like n=1 Tax=Mytilus edulis TaxID=6550 RepID=UPI0039EF7BBC